jgi:O-acetyl-ADP-ribose deacetylase (regulator of RNase III)
LNPKKVYHILIDSYKYDWIYSYKYYVIVDDNGLSEIQDLKNCYYNSLKIGSEEKFETLVFSNISTGVYGFPKDLASKYSFEVISNFLIENEYPKKVVICCYDIENLQLYSNIIKENL